MRLFRVELTRFRSRRINQLAVLGILGVILVMLYGSWRTSVPLSDVEKAQIQAQYDASVKDWDENKDEYIASCKEQEAADQETSPDVDYGCEQGGPGDIESWMYGPTPFAERADRVLPDYGLLMVFGAFAMGVSFIAAEFSSGAIGNWLTFEPRRGRVYGTKVGASGIAVIPIALVTGAIMVGGTWLAYSLNDNVGTMTGEIWRDVGAGGIRLLLLTIGFAMLGVAVGTIVRHTAAAVGILVGYAIVVEGILGNTFEGLRPWLLQLNLQAVLSNGTSYWETVCESGPTGQVCHGIEKTVSLTNGVVTLSVVLVVVVAVAALVFRRRDVN
ncbi:ABC-2 type transport system permease protein [Sanguibacter gelidistatuariae]|uniref:ABC-2 type transport system permease protein n=1 Tax=Sanguibacter gelidistatuariae TaxID=1814289 RepID=A0A1G6GWI3_9MICO|nr:ABC transporter permease subunit [Sanguibacter gelidistatuariae]SDB86334.1 ABC-2 type transport system permease protein [Sanguibacter gelidistatuariae]